MKVVDGGEAGGPTARGVTMRGQDNFSRSLKQVLSIATDTFSLSGVRGPEDLSHFQMLHAISRVPISEAGAALSSMSVDLESLQAEVDAVMKEAESACAGKWTLQTAAKHAESMGDEHVGTEHLLLALADEGQGSFGLLLAKHGITSMAVHRGITEARKGKKPEPSAPAGPSATVTVVASGQGKGGAGDRGSSSESGTGSSRPEAKVTSVPRSSATQGSTRPVSKAASGVTKPAAKADPSAVVSHSAAEPVGNYPHARRVGNLLFLSGLGPRKRGSKVIPGVMLDDRGSVIGHDIEAQVRSCFENVRIVLEECGSSWANIVDVTVFLTDMKNDFAIFNRLWADYFSENPPARTTVEINCLPTPIAFEVKVIATVGPSDMSSPRRMV